MERTLGEIVCTIYILTVLFQLEKKCTIKEMYVHIYIYAFLKNQLYIHVGKFSYLSVNKMKFDNI